LLGGVGWPALYMQESGTVRGYRVFQLAFASCIPYLDGVTWSRALSHRRGSGPRSVHVFSINSAVFIINSIPPIVPMTIWYQTTKVLRPSCILVSASGQGRRRRSHSPIWHGASMPWAHGGVLAALPTRQQESGGGGGDHARCSGRCHGQTSPLTRIPEIR
jgi:hypothetical protein